LTLVSASADPPEGLVADDPGAADTTGQVPDLPINAAFFGWLVDANDRAASACWDLLGLVREFRSSPSTAGLPCSGTAVEDV
jgi:hypothetical protein